MEYRKLWIGLFVVMAASFAVLGYYGREIYRQAPPIPGARDYNLWQGTLHRTEYETGRMYGSQPAASKWAPCGGMVPMLHRTGRQTFFTGSLNGFWHTGPRPTTALKTMPTSGRRSRRP